MRLLLIIMLGAIEDWLGIERSIKTLPAADAQSRPLWVAIRRVLIMLLGALEEHLGVERSIVPRHHRARGRMREQ